MSGNLDITSEDDRQRRYNKMQQMINNNSVDPSTSGSLYSFKLGNSAINKTHQNQNSVLGPQQFYKSASHQNVSEMELLAKPTNSVYSQSETSTSIFRLPQTTQDYSAWLHYKMEIDILMSSLQTIKDKARLKFLVRLFKNAVYIVHHQQYPISNPTLLVDAVSNAVKEKYNSSASKSVGSSSIISESQMTHVENPRVVLTDRISSQILKTNADNDRMPLPPFSNNLMTQNKKLANQCSSNRNIPLIDNEDLMDESCTTLFTESQIAQQRDENLANKFNDISNRISQATDGHNDNTKRKKCLKANPVFTKPRAVKNNNINESKRADKENNFGNNCMMNNTHAEIPAGTKGFSQRGRPIKGPLKFWQGNESKLNGEKSKDNLKKSSKDMLNDSMTLRSSRVVDRSPALLESNRDNSMTSSKHNNVNKGMKGKVNKSKTNGKENSVITQDSKPSKTKKNMNTRKTKGVTETKVKPTKKAESKSNKMTSTKRKSEELHECQPQNKRCKGFQDVSGNISSDDELFGSINYKKSTKQALQVFSPTSGIQSAKRAVGMMLSKETPPCKTLGLLMNASSHSAVSSVVKVPPAKKNQPVKRVTKIIENKKLSKVKPSPGNKYIQKGNQNYKIVQDRKTPLTAVTLSTIMGNEMESSDDDDDYDDGDLE